MTYRQIIDEGLRAAGINEAITNISPLSGGCIHEVLRVELAGGRGVVAKVADSSRASMLGEERAGLELLARANAVLVPRVLGLHVRETASVLLMQHLVPHPAGESAWRQFGDELARLHLHGGCERYGFEGGNHLGTTPQPNDWHDDWVEFNRNCRLGHQLSLARRNNLLSPAEAHRIERVIDRLDEFIPRTPKPALLHGDLWSGNALPTVDDRGRSRIAVIDPACSFGDGYADIAMMRLFGGFPQACFEAYEANISEHAQIDTRIAVYQLYHVLNHANLFGRGYVAQAMGLASTLVC